MDNEEISQVSRQDDFLKTVNRYLFRTLAAFAEKESFASEKEDYFWRNIRSETTVLTR